RFGSARGLKPDRPVVDVVHEWGERRSAAIEVDRSRIHCYGPRRRRGAGAFRAIGEERGVALVEPDDGVAQVVAGEEFAPPASALGVDLDQRELLDLVGPDIERLAG